MSWLQRKRPEESNPTVAEPQEITLRLRCTPEEARQAEQSLQKLLGLIGLEEIRRLGVLMESPVKRRQALESLYSNT